MKSPHRSRKRYQFLVLDSCVGLAGHSSVRAAALLKTERDALLRVRPRPRRDLLLEDVEQSSDTGTWVGVDEGRAARASVGCAAATSACPILNAPDARQAIRSDRVHYRSTFSGAGHSVAPAGAGPAAFRTRSAARRTGPGIDVALSSV